MQVTAKTIVAKISSSPSGRHCLFIPLEDGWGLKVYRSEAMRDRCYEWQSVASKLNLAPLVFNKCKIGPFYCYETEMANTNDFDDTNKHREEIEKYNETLENMLGIHYTDACWFNYGYICRDGIEKLVLIDWDMSESYGLPNDIYDRWDEDDVCEDWVADFVIADYEDKDIE